MKLLKYSVIFWSVMYVSGIVLIYFFQARLVFAPTVLDSNYQFNFQTPFEEAYLDSDTGHKIHYLKFKNEKPKAVILFFHGNGGGLDSWGYFGQKLSEEAKSDVWILDYPGYGKSSRAFADSGKEMVELGEELLELVRMKYKETPIILYGRSLGSGIASALSADASVDGLILETPYYSTSRLAKEMFPVVPAFIFKYDLDNTKIKKAKIAKVLILHGKKDKLIPYQHALDLKNEFDKRVDLISFSKGEHNNLSTFDDYWISIKDYIARSSEQSTL